MTIIILVLKVSTGKKDILVFYNYIYKYAKMYLVFLKKIFKNLDLLEYYNEKTRS